ncbi:MAG TPA: hypothetical protein DET40_22060 [Lentisphaeria bacterium]|nr:MAG: hypothetical protein A2X45_04150 [Lentisphaerae bacterium GWF2_50_93]HCE46239.1 hypothetical protein [Lentisphaeria bacterium]
MKLTLLVFLAVFSLSCYSQNEFVAALDKGDLAKIKSLLEAKPEMLNKEREYSTYPVFEATEKSKLDIVKFYIEKGAKLDVKTSKYGDNIVLFMARTMNNPNESKTKTYIAMLDLFAAQKASFTVTDKDGNGALKILADKKISTANVKNYMEIVNYYIKNGSKITDKSNSGILHALLATEGIPMANKELDCGSFEAAKEFVALGVGVSEVDDAKNTPLHVVLLNKRVTDDKKADIVKFLMEKGARNNVKNKAGQTPEELVKKESQLYEIIKKTKPKK